MRSLSLVGSALARLIETRIRLMSAEFELERMRFIRCLILSILGATLLGASCLVATALLFFSVAEENQIIVLAITVAILFSTAAVCIGISLHYVFGGPPPFAATTDAFREDRACLSSPLKK